MKHSRISLIERAAEVYDFGAALRAPAQMPVPPEPVEAQAPVVEAPVEVEAPAPVAAPPEPVRAAPPPRADGVAVIDRAALAEKGFIVPEGPVSELAEEFRLVKRQLLATIERRVSLPEEKRRSVLVCSAQPKEGKSFCAVNLALSLAGERETEVLLIDGDVAKHDMLALLGIEGGPGLVDALADPDADPESFVIRTDVPGLSVLPAGAHANDVTELLASDRMRALLARLIAADSRRIVLFDSPPVLMASPASVLAAHVGQALVVVRADRTTEADLRETIDLLSGCDHVALLLNAAGIAVTGRNFGAYYEGRGHED
jgi:exopolysaccharide/PEP-CTERM locus tyrosine autokinase